MKIEYTVAVHRPQAHLFAITMRLDGMDGTELQLCLPDWIPGSYMIRDFSKSIVSLTAHSGQAEVHLQSLGKSRWQVPEGFEHLVLNYQVYAWDWSVRSAHLDQHHGFFNGTSLFLYVEGHTGQPHQVVLLAPEHTQGLRWDVATTLPAVQVDVQGFGRYEAPDYDALIDHPVSMSAHTRVHFDACGVPHEVVFCGSHHGDLERIAHDLKPICEYQIRLFGEPAPIDRYLFLVQLTEGSYGGLEHRSSTALMVSREHLPVPGVEKRSENYIEFLGLCSHEYFHTWNVKRIKPAAFTPYRLQEENYTELLWFFEGVTSYYDDLAMVRSGVIDVSTYLELLGRMVTRVHRGQGRAVQSVTDSSLSAWNKFYKQDENAPNAIVSYYAKGALVALCLDVKLREAGVADGLDALMRMLWQQWLSDPRGLAEQEPQRLAAELAGQDLSAFFDLALYSTSELPLADSLSILGIKLQWRSRSGLNDRGGKAAKDGARYIWLGANIADAPGGVRITHVFSGGAAEQAGLAAGDRVVAVGALAVEKETLDARLTRFAELGQAELHYFRQGELFTTLLPLRSGEQDTAVLSVQVPERAGKWLGSVLV